MPGADWEGRQGLTDPNSPLCLAAGIRGHIKNGKV